MFNFTSAQRYYLYVPPTDMRKGFNGLSGLVRSGLKADPLSGEVFIFINRRRDRMKLLVWDRTGYWIYYKRLEQGTFELPAKAMGGVSCQIKWTELVLILEGIQLGSVRQRKRYSRPQTQGLSPGLGK